MARDEDLRRRLSRGLAPPMNIPPPMLAIRQVVAFGRFVPYPDDEWAAETQEVWHAFKPKGLIIWNGPDGARVDDLWIGGQGGAPQLKAGPEGIPWQWFASGWSWEDVQRLIAEGKQSAGWNEFQVAYRGARLRLSIRSALECHTMQALLWGETIR